MTRRSREADSKVCGARGPAPLRALGAEKIQLPYDNRFETIWEYKESFLRGRIDFFSVIGPGCPICGKSECYRQITPYFRYAIELFPEFGKDRIPIARFLCRNKHRTFSLLPIQLIPYFQYTLRAVIGTLLLGLGYRQTGRRGFYGASISVDADSLVTPWLVVYWLATVARGLQRAHAVLGRFYNLSDVVSSPSYQTASWKQVSGYFIAVGLTRKAGWMQAALTICRRYSRSTGRFLFGSASRQRTGIGK